MIAAIIKNKSNCWWLAWQLYMVPPTLSLHRLPYGTRELRAVRNSRYAKVSRPRQYQHNLDIDTSAFHWVVDQHCDREHVVFVLIQSVVATAAATVSHLNHVSHFEVAVVSLLVVLFFFIYAVLLPWFGLQCCGFFIDRGCKKKVWDNKNYRCLIFVPSIVSVFS